jgi:branched-chain amino acid transport system ATP-binding protein
MEREMSLQAQGLSKRYGGLLAVDRVDLDARPGQITSVIGPNGAGKTTLLNLLSGVVRADSGSWSVGDQPAAALLPHELARLGLTRTYQSPQLFDDMNVLDTVRVGAHLHGSAGFISAMLRIGGARRQEARLEALARAAIDRVGLPAHLLGRRADELAYGLQRRVEIARALAMQPRVLLLDEPAAGLNPRETDEMATFVHSLAQDGLVVVLVEHDMEMVMGISHKIVVMNFGCKIAEGTPAQIQSNDAVIAAYLGTDVEAKHA